MAVKLFDQLLTVHVLQSYVFRCQADHLQLQWKVTPFWLFEGFQALLQIVNEARGQNVQHEHRVHRIFQFFDSLSFATNPCFNVDSKLLEKQKHWI